MITEQEYVNVSEAAKLIGVTQSRVSHMIRAGSIPVLRFSRKSVLIRRSDVEREIYARARKAIR